MPMARSHPTIPFRLITGWSYALTGTTEKQPNRPLTNESFLPDAGALSVRPPKNARTARPLTPRRPAFICRMTRLGRAHRGVAVELRAPLSEPGAHRRGVGPERHHEHMVGADDGILPARTTVGG